MGKITGREIKIGIGKEKITGTPTGIKAYALQDTASPFTATMVGAQVVKTTSPVAYSYVTAFVSAVELTLKDDIFTATPIAYAYEVAAPRGTQVAPIFWIPRRAFDFDEKVLSVPDEQSYGVIEKPLGLRVVSKWGEGAITGVMRNKSIGLFLLNVFGQVSSSPYASPDNEVYKHTFTVRTHHQHPSLTLAVEDDNEELAFPLCMVKTLTIIADLGEMVLFTADLISKKGETATPTLTPGYAVEKDFAAGDIAVKFANAASELGAASATKVKSVEIAINQDIEKDDVLSSVDPDDFLNKTVQVDITIVKDYDSNTFKGYFTSGTPKALRVTIENTDAVLQSGGAKYPKLEIDFNKVNVVDWVPTKDLDSILTETLTLRAAFKIADSKMIQAVLENLTVTY